MDYAQMKQEKETRYEEFCKTFADQLQLLGYIQSLEKDNENIRETIKTATTNKSKRYNNKIIRINNKDIKKYKKALSKMPPVPEFK